MRWAELGNGELLTAPEQDGFEVMVTGDKNLSYQQALRPLEESHTAASDPKLGAVSSYVNPQNASRH